MAFPIYVFPWTHKQACVKQCVCMQTYASTVPEAILLAHFHPTDIGIFRKSKPIDKLLQRYKKSIANFFALITTWTFNMHPVATVCVPQAWLPIGLMSIKIIDSDRGLKMSSCSLIFIKTGLDQTTLSANAIHPTDTTGSTHTHRLLNFHWGVQGEAQLTNTLYNNFMKNAHS